MTWRSEYRQASFRGVHFKVKTAESSYGRRQVLHEFPQIDTPYTEDMGRSADEFSVEGYVIGQNYHLALQALIDACRDEAGPGTLIHPYRGEKLVVCRGLKVRESSEEGGMATVVMTFIEAGKVELFDPFPDAEYSVKKSSAKVREEAKRAFLEKFLTDGLPGFVLDSAAGMVGDLADTLTAPANLITSNLAAASEFTNNVRKLSAEANDLAALPDELATQIDNTLDSMRRAFSGAGGALRNLFDTYSGADAEETGTPIRRQEQANANAVNGLLRSLAIAQAATAEAATDHPSYQDASAARDGLATRLDDEAEATTDDGTYEALVSLRTAVVQAIPPRGQTLPNIVTYTPRVTMPALVIAHQLYGDASRADEIVARNKPAHPGFMPGGRALEVLSDG